MPLTGLNDIAAFLAVARECSFTRAAAQLTFNAAGPMLDAALAGFGLAYLPQDSVQAYLAGGQLIQVLADWCPPYPGYHLHYPSRSQPTPAFSLLVDALRYHL